jgi:hypothetical protein
MLWRVKSSWCFFIAETTIDDKYGHYYYYGSSERNKAMTLETLISLGLKEKHLQ